MSNRISGILLITLIALCSIIVMEVRSGVPSVEDLKAFPERNKDSTQAGPVRLTLPPLAALSETIDRPLFVDTRRPPDVGTSEALATAAPIPLGPSASFSLSAIVITEDERAVLLTHPQSGALTRVAEGETVAGWRLDKVENDRVIFSKDGETQEAALRTFGPPPPRRGVQRQSPAISGGDTPDRGPRQTQGRTRLRPLMPQEAPVSER